MPRRAGQTAPARAGCAIGLHAPDISHRVLLSVLVVSGCTGVAAFRARAERLLAASVVVGFASGGGLSNGLDDSGVLPGTVALDGVLIDGNIAFAGGGAGVLTMGALTANKVVLLNNVAQSWGGGLLQVGDATVSDRIRIPAP